MGSYNAGYPDEDHKKIKDIFLASRPLIMMSNRTKNLYKLARKNITIEREEIISKIYNIELNTFRDSLIDFSVTCSKGTYIRVLGSEIAEKIGTIGYLIKLVRTGIGDYKISDSLSIHKFESQWKSLEN